MNGLWADGWFYISSAGLLVSGVLFFSLLGQYRAAADAADGAQPMPEPDVAPSPVRPIYIPDEPAEAPKVSVASAERAEAQPAPVPKEPQAEPVAAASNYAGLDRRRENATGGISPAVVYLQNIKTQLEGLHGQVAELTKRVESVTGRDEALIERLGELAHAVEELKSSAPAAEPEQPARRTRRPAAEKAVEPPPLVEPVAKPAPVPEPAPAAEPVAMKLELGPAPGAQSVKADIPAPVKADIPAPVAAEIPVPEKAPEPVPQTSPVPDKTIVLEPGDIFKAPEPAPVKAEAAEEQPARRGPVWPV